MHNNKRMQGIIAVVMAAALTIGSVAVTDTTSDAASKKAVKSVALKIGKTKVTKKTYILKKGKTAKIKVSVTPAKAKKTISFKSSKKAVATVTSKGKVTAKKTGTAKITVTVTGKNKKKTSTWVKIRVKKNSGGGNAAETPDATETPGATATPEPTPFEAISFTTESNPIGTTDADGNQIYGGDPSVLVDGDTVYLYVGHDTAKASSYNIPEYCVYSTKDLKNWTYHGSVLSMKNVSWANNAAAWAAQVMKYNNKYYMYYCSWNSKDSGNQSIGVAVADSPTGPFTDIGQALVKGSVTTDPTSTYNDIDPTAWIETDENGVEHRYLAWGNEKFFVCELNEDMVSVKDINGDGKITFGRQEDGKTSKDADIIERDMSALGNYTEAPWLYRRQDENGNYTGKYYLFFAYGFREQMAYTTTDDLMDGTWDDGGNVVMEPTATSNTNHMAVFDFKGKTYFVYHNGSMPGGNGYRRIPCITEVNFEEDGSIKEIPESAAGVSGTTSKIYVSSGAIMAHKNYVNSAGDTEYPYTTVDVGLYANPAEADTEWVITSGKADKSNADYVSIQSENKPGLYLTANDDQTVTLAQDYDTKKIAETALKQTFKKVAGLSDPTMVSFESVSQPGMYITLVNCSLALTDGSDKIAATFSIDKQPSASSSLSSENDFAELKIDGETVDTSTGECNLERSLKTDEIKIEPSISDKKGYFTTELTDKDGNASTSTKLLLGSDDLSKTITLTGQNTYIKLTVYAENMSAVKTFMIHVSQDVSEFTIKDNVVARYDFEDSTDNAIAMTKGASSGDALVTAKNPKYTYEDGKDGKGIVLNGTYGLKLADSKDLNLDESYTISFWMKPDKIGSSFDPTIAAGTFSPTQYWLNLTFDAKIWSYKNGYIATDASNAYKEDEWQHVAISVNGAKAGSTANTVTASLYVDGDLVSSGDIASGIMKIADGGVYFGVNAWDAYFKGTLDNVLIINRALSAGEIGVIASADGNVADK